MTRMSMLTVIKLSVVFDNVHDDCFYAEIHKVIVSNGEYCLGLE